MSGFTVLQERTYYTCLFAKSNHKVDISHLSPQDFLEPMVLVANSVRRPSFLALVYSILPSFGHLTSQYDSLVEYDGKSSLSYISGYFRELTVRNQRQIYGMILRYFGLNSV